MNLEFVFVVFCLTVIALVAIRYGENKVAEKAISAMSELAHKTLRVLETITGRN